MKTPRASWFSILLTALVHAAAAAVFTWPLATTASVVSAAVGSAVGASIAARVAPGRLRATSLFALAISGLFLAVGLRALVTGTAGITAALGPATSLRVGDALFFGLGAASISLGLRFAAIRRPALGALEVLAAALSFGQLVVAHRQGAINRPFELADPILAAGGDPTIIFLVVGACATAVIVLLMLRERSAVRSLLHLAVVALLLFAVMGTSRVLELPPPPPGGAGLGLRPEDGESDEERDGEGGGESDDPNQEDDLEFRDQLDNSSSQVPVGVVLFHDDYSPPSGMYYFRQGAFSQYNGRRLVAATMPGVDQDIARDFPLRAYEIAGAPPALRDLDPSRREKVQTTVALLAEHTRPFGLESPIALQPATNPDPERFRRTYSVTSGVLVADLGAMLGAPAGDPSWSPEVRALYTLGPDDPRYTDLAQRIIREQLPPHLQDDPIAKTAAITSWLGAQGTYSLRSRHAEADDPTADFLFGDVTGYCVHFAHAGAYLMRAAGLPTRVATGYAIDEANRQGGSALLVSGETSHAWPEVYLDGFGWVVTDIAPQNVISPPPSPPDPDLQRLLGELARGLRPLPPDPEAPLPATIAAGIDIARAIGLGLLWLAALLFAFVVVAKIWRRVAPSFASAGAQPRVAYRAALDRLGELSLRRQPGESREHFAARIRARVPSFDALTELHVGAAFGSARAAKDAAGARDRLRSVRAELGDTFPLWRRVLGALTPWSWLRSR